MLHGLKIISCVEEEVVTDTRLEPDHNFVIVQIGTIEFSVDKKFFNAS